MRVRERDRKRETKIQRDRDKEKNINREREREEYNIFFTFVCHKPVKVLSVRVLETRLFCTFLSMCIFLS